MSTVDKSKKPQFKAEVECPCCKTVLLVKFWKQNVAEKVEPEWAVETDVNVLVQGRMFSHDNPEVEVEATGS